MNTQNRWLLAAAGVVMQIAFGAVYAWSVFRIPLSHAHGWTVAEVTAAFEIAIFVVGFAAFAGGLWMKQFVVRYKVRHRPVVAGPLNFVVPPQRICSRAWAHVITGDQQ